MALDPFQSAIEQYAKLDHSRLPYARFYVSRETVDILRRRYATYIDGPVRPSTMLGVPVSIDDSLPLGAVELRSESPFEQLVREARETGATINVMNPVAFLPELTPVPTPTLRALLWHWAKKLRNR